ncbi:MAG: hypothetical protein AB8B95_05100 [Pseudohongiellaceae bacterium]
MSDRITLHCWQCGALAKNVLLPFSRNEECNACMADLRTCKGCENYSDQAADQCREDRAEAVTNKETANFCDFFKASSQAFQAQNTAEADKAKAKLAELFGDTAAPNITPTNENDHAQNEEVSEADKALAELNRLFSKD